MLLPRDTPKTNFAIFQDIGKLLIRKGETMTRAHNRLLWEKSVLSALALAMQKSFELALAELVALLGAEAAPWLDGFDIKVINELSGCSLAENPSSGERDLKAASIVAVRLSFAAIKATLPTTL